MSEWKGKTPEQEVKRDEPRTGNVGVGVSGGYGEGTGFAAPQNVQVSDLREGGGTAATSSPITNPAGSESSMASESTSRERVDAAAEANEQMRQTAQKAKESAAGMVSTQKHRAGEELGRLSSALRAAAERLEQDNDRTIAQYVSTAAEKVSQFERRLKERDTDSLLDDIEGFARRHPELVFGGMFLGGLAIARFLKSSRQKESGYGRRDSFRTPRPERGQLFSEEENLPLTEEERRYVPGYEPVGESLTGAEQPGGPDLERRYAEQISTVSQR